MGTPMLPCRLPILCSPLWYHTNLEVATCLATTTYLPPEDRLGVKVAVCFFEFCFLLDFESEERSLLPRIQILDDSYVGSARRIEENNLAVQTAAKKTS